MKETVRSAILKEEDVYLCVPMRDCLDYKVTENQKHAERYAVDMMEQYDCKVLAPQAYLPNLLDLDDPSQYQLSLQFRECKVAMRDLHILTDRTSGVFLKTGKNIYHIISNFSESPKIAIQK